MAKEKGLAVRPETSAEKLIEQAITANVPVETMERLLAMRTAIKAEQAQEAFNAAMADFQAQCPTIVKTKEVHTRSGATAYRYAPIESIVSQVKELLQKHGFSYSFRQELKEAGVKVTCVVVHSLGHSEEYSMEVPFGTKTEIMSQSQVTAAASTFAKRYAFCNAFGILTGDEDNDGAKFDTTPIPVRAKAVSVGADTPTAVIDAPWRNPKVAKLLSKDEQRKKIADLCRSIALVDLTTKEDFEEYVRDNTGLNLVEANFPAIIRKLEALATEHKDSEADGPPDFSDEEVSDLGL